MHNYYYYNIRYNIFNVVINFFNITMIAFLYAF